MKDSVGHIIREARIKKGLTQMQLGELCGLCYTVISYIETDKYTYGKGSLNKVASALNLDKVQLLDTYNNQYTAPHLQVQKKIRIAIDDWYDKWKGRITDNEKHHRLAIAKEELKHMLCHPYDMTQQKIFDEVHEDILNNRS